MISYHISIGELYQRIDRAFPRTFNKDGKLRSNSKDTWIVHARHLTKKCRDNGAFDAGYEDIWGQLKPIFAHIQGDGVRVKCGYCESRLHLWDNDKPDGDIEHFRPKAKVVCWLDSSSESNHGYYLLAYHPRNYLISCRVCNVKYKGNFFPTKSCSYLKTANPNKLAEEKAMLIHPLDPNDPKLEEVVSFDCTLAVLHKGLSDDVNERGGIMIEFFKINERIDLQIGRAEIIRDIFISMIACSVDSSLFDVLSQIVNKFEPHYNCAHSFLELCHRNPTLARSQAEEAMKFLSEQQQVSLRP